jgi:hypothetical protein
MKEEEVRERLQASLDLLTKYDLYLLEHDLSERCIASRLAMHLQNLFGEFFVDVEYNRVGARPKSLELPEECANYRNENGESLVVPDVIVHRRGPEGPNLLVLEMKKTTNREPRECDQMRIRAFREQLKYDHAALIECETRPGCKPTITINQWL